MVWPRDMLFIHGDCDTAYYTQALFNLSRLSAPISALNIFFPGDFSRNILFGSHFEYTSTLYAPLYWLPLRPISISYYIFPLVTIILSAIWWNKLFKNTENRLPVTLGYILLFLSPWSGFYTGEFFFDRFAIPWILANIYFYKQKKFNLFILTLLITTGFKEYFAVYASAFCLLYFLQYRYKKALIASVIFLIYTAVVMKFIMPHFFFGDSNLNYLFAPDESSSLLARLLSILQNAFSFPSLKYIFLVFAPFLFIPILAPHLILPALPIFAILILSGKDPLMAKVAYYNVIPNTLFAVSFVYGMKNIATRKTVTFLVALIVIAFLSATELHSILYSIKSNTLSLLASKDKQSEITEVLAYIEEGDVVSTTSKLTPYLVKDPSYIFPRPFATPEIGATVDKIIISKYHGTHLLGFSSDAQLEARLTEIAQQFGFKTLYASEKVKVLEKQRP